jgi:uncharacterized integral membrane protein (TIGR00697 family)
MANEIILAIEILFVFTAILICKKLFGKYGVIGWVAVATILANLLTAKNVELFGLYTSIGTVWFASTFLATDILSECYTEQDAKTAVWFGVFANVLFIIGSQITLRYTASPIDYADGFMHGLFALNLRISISSSIMYIIANLADIYLYNYIRRKMDGRAIWFRNNVSTILTNCLENFGFIALAFWGIYSGKDIITIAVSTSIIEMLVALCDTPFLYIAKRIKEK